MRRLELLFKKKKKNFGKKISFYQFQLFISENILILFEISLTTPSPYLHTLSTFQNSFHTLNTNEMNFEEVRYRTFNLILQSVRFRV